MFQPKCGLSVIGEYNPANGFCEVSGDREIGINRGFGTEYTCQALTFQNSFKDCFAADSCESSPNCLTSDAAEKPKYPTEFVQVKDPLVVTGKIGPSSPNYRYWQLDEIGHEVLDLTLEPGQMLGFGAAQIGYRMETDSLKVDRLASTSESAAGAYFVRFGLSKPEFVFFTTQCTEPNQNYTAKLDDLDTATESPSNTTVCQTPIDGMALELVAEATIQKPEWEPDIYLKIGEKLTGIITTDQGLPITLIKDFKDGADEQITELVTDADARTQSFEFAWPTAGSYEINITMYNLHSNEEFGSVKYAHNNTKMIHVQNPFIAFTFELDENWLVSQEVEFKFLSSSPDQPSRPLFYTCSWNDSSSESQHAFDEDNSIESSPGSFEYHLKHVYSTAGVYNPVCVMNNMVDSQEFTKEITIQDTITDFIVDVHFKEKETGILRLGLGADKNKVPLEAKVVFKFRYTTGTIETIVVNSVTDGVVALVNEYVVTDKFMASEFEIEMDLTEEGSFNYTFEPKSSLVNDYPPFPVEVEIVGQVRGIKLDDFEIITNIEETKNFEVTFDSVGAGACLGVDFGDGVQVAYGDQYFCQGWSRTSSFLFYEGYETISNPFQFNHIYFQFGVSTVKVYAMNFVTEVETEDQLDVIVTSAPCAPPEVRIPLNSTNGLAPRSHKMSDSVTVKSLANIDCSNVLSTKKKWKIEKVVINPSNYQEDVTEIQTSLESLTNSELIIPARTLGYGVYKLTISVRIWDEDDSDPMLTRLLPFERSAYTYIEILPSDLLVKMSEGGADLITKGRDDGEIILEPYRYSYDPDFPELQDNGLDFRWYCKMEAESWPFDSNYNIKYNISALINIPVVLEAAPSNQQAKTGCFGTGPGAINVTQGILAIDALAFHTASSDISYEILLEVRKDTFDYQPGFVRKGSKLMQIIVTPGKPPPMIIECATPSLCFTDSQGTTYFNPSSRLALKATCTEPGTQACDSLTYSWTAADKNEVALPEITEEYSPTGVNIIDLAINPTYFADNQDIKSMNIKLTADNGVKGVFGKYLKVNEVPKDGECNVDPQEGIALTDEFFLLCENWVDPEGQEIKQYSISSEEGALATVKFFDKNEKLKLSLGAGYHYINVTIEDAWGAKAVYQLPPVNVRKPDPADFQDFAASGALDSAAASGDTGTLLMLLQAQAQVIADGSVELESQDEQLIQLGEPTTVSPETKEFNQAVSAGQMKVDSLKLLNSSSAAKVSDLPTATVVAKTLEDIVGEPPLQDEKSQLGIEAMKSATDLVEDIVNSIDALDIATPEELVPVTESILTTVGTLLDSIQATANLEVSENSTVEDVCGSLNPIDKVSADKPGVMEYDTDIGDDIEMKVPEDPEVQKCQGVVDSAKLVGAEAGIKLLEMAAQMGRSLLAKAVVNEEIRIETNTVTMYVKK